MITTEIPIKNYYYLLSYAWNLLTERDILRVGIEDCGNLDDLFGRIICRGTELLIKKGIKKSYIESHEHTGNLKGKILFKESLPDLFRSNNMLCCEFDDLTHNILDNQIIFSTLHELLVSSTNHELKRSIRRLLSFSSSITRIKLQPNHFKIAKASNRNGLYALLINVCEILYLSKLPNLESEERIFQDFINDERELAKLFEMFTYNFYRSKLGTTGTIVTSQTQIAWGLQAMDHVSQSFLPKMKTDVIIQYAHQRIIIETKFYKETFQSFFEKETIHSSNLYQLQSYLLNDKMTGDEVNRVGLLIYPTIKPSNDLNYKFDEKTQLQVRTIDLSSPWQEIEARMLSFLQFGDRIMEVD